MESTPLSVTDDAALEKKRLVNERMRLLRERKRKKLAESNSLQVQNDSVVNQGGYDHVKSLVITPPRDEPIEVLGEERHRDPPPQTARELPPVTPAVVEKQDDHTHHRPDHANLPTESNPPRLPPPADSVPPPTRNDSGSVQQSNPPAPHHGRSLFGTMTKISIAIASLAGLIFVLTSSDTPTQQQPSDQQRQANKRIVNRI